MLSRNEREEYRKFSRHADNDRFGIKGRSPNRSGTSSPSTSLGSPNISPKLGRAANSRLVSGSVSSHWITDAKSRAGLAGGPSARRRAPGFILRPRPQTVSCGERLILKCTLLGHPKPVVSWDRDGNKLEEDGRIQIRESDSDFFLEISDTTANDAGRYTVQAKNSLGKQTASVDIVISEHGESVIKSAKSRENHTQSLTHLTDKMNNNPEKTRQKKTSSAEITMKTAKTTSYKTVLSTRNKETEHRNSDSANDTPSFKIKSAPPSNVTPPKFIKLLADKEEVFEGGELTLSCTISEPPVPQMAWKKNGMRVSRYDPNAKISYDGGVASLTMSHVRSSDAGEYSCIAKNSYGETKCSCQVAIKAKQKEEKPKFRRSPKDIRIEEGDSLELEAEVDGYPEPEVLWSLDGEEIVNGECIYKNNLAKLVLQNVSLESSGQYMCTAMNKAGEDSVACRVRIRQKQVNIAPEFTAPLSDIKTTEGEDIILRCKTSGIPQPEVQWFCDDELLESGNGITISNSDGNPTLELSQATLEDAGCYSCVAVNPEGKCTTSCQVVVSDLPKDEKPAEDEMPEFLSKFENYVRAVEGEMVVLECSVRGFPKPEVSWTIGGRPPKNAKMSFENEVAMLTIPSVSSDQSGDVLIVAENIVGTIKHEGRLYVRAKREPPSFVTHLPESVEVQEGKEVTFGCQIKGHPQPRVSWTRNGKNLSVLNTETSYEEGKASVRIRKAGGSDGGKYVCTARNLSGETESVCQVTVVKIDEIKKPQFLSLLSDLTLEDSQDIRLECRVKDVKQSDISWYVDGQKLEAEDGDATFKDGVATMVLEDAMPEDSGLYECVAKYSSGEIRTKCKVVVNAKKPKEESPSFPIQLEDMIVREKEDIILKCQVKGNPRPTITWLLDGDPIPDADSKYTEDGNLELFLPESVPDDDGVYTCIAQNKMNRVMCSCKVTIEAIPKNNKKKEVPSFEKSKENKPSPNEVPVMKSPIHRSEHTVNGNDSMDENTGDVPLREGPDRPPKFVEVPEDRIVPDGSINYKIIARVSGIPPPSVKWFVNGQEIGEGDDFKYETDGDMRRLVFSEIFPDDSGNYTCVATNSAGKDEAHVKLTVEEIDGDPPNFLVKPRPLTVNAGENALFTCKVDGEPEPNVQWLYCNQPISANERIKVVLPNADNNYTHTLQISDTRIEDAGRYASRCSNLLGDVTCTVSLIVNAAKSQEEQKDFRNVLRKAEKTKTADPTPAEQLDFRGVLKPSDAGGPEAVPGKTENSPDFREMLSRPVRTRVLSEDERKNLKAEQKDFRGTLVRKVETKTVTNELLKTKTPEQKDFRGEALRKKVQTKEYAEDLIKQKQAEQKDFRPEALKTKVVTKAYKEENIKKKRAEQVDFREVLSPTKKQLSKDESPSLETAKGVDMPVSIAKMKLNKEKMDHNTVATKRTRTRGGTESRKQRTSEPDPLPSKEPQFTKEMEDIHVQDSEPFQLICSVTGCPRPKVKWFFGEEAVESDADISIVHEGDVCKLSVAESFPDDEGTYTCHAENEHGTTQCSARVTVITREIRIPAKVTAGPDDMTVLKGNELRLRYVLAGTPTVKSIWRKGKHELKPSSYCSIDVSQKSAMLIIARTENDDSGCYTLQVKNSFGVDQFSSSVSIVDAPDPPGKPHVNDISQSGIVLSWYGSGYDGGSPITSYRIQTATVTDTGLSEWAAVASTNSTSCTLKNLELEKKFVFRVCAENKYGISCPGEQSETILNATKKLGEHSEEGIHSICTLDFML